VLQRLFSAFPGGWPGIALLLLRAVLAAVLLLQGFYYLGEPSPAPEAWLIGAVGVASGALLFIGLCTPLAGTVGGVGAIGVAFSFIPAPPKTLFESYVPVAFALTVAVALIILGPGAFSVDARLFGRREIIIPLPRPSNE